MTARVGVTIRALELLALTGSKLTRGEIRHALNLPTDIAIDSRVRDARKSEYGAFAVSVDHAKVESEDGDRIEYRYSITGDDERTRALEFVRARRGGK